MLLPGIVKIIHAGDNNRLPFRVVWVRANLTVELARFADVKQARSVATVFPAQIG